MVAGAFAIDFIEGCFAFNPQQVFHINSNEVKFTKNYFDDLITQIEHEIQGDIGQAVVIAPISLASDLKKYFAEKLDEIGIMKTAFIRAETLYAIGGLTAAKITVAKNETVAIFYSKDSTIIGDQWIKSADEKLIFEKRIYCLSDTADLSKLSFKSVNHILISDKVLDDPTKNFQNTNIQIFRENGNTFLLVAALIKARILMKEESLKGFDAEDIGDLKITLSQNIVHKDINVIGISIGSDTFSIAKYSNEKIEVIKNAKNEETMKCIVFWKNRKFFIDGDNEEGAHPLEYCIDLLGAQTKEPREPFAKLELAENDDAPNTKVCYNINGKIINPEKVALELLKYIKATIVGNENNAKMIFALSSEIKNATKKCEVFLRLAKQAGLEASGIVENNIALCLGGSQNSNKKENGTFIGINFSDAKVDTIIYRFAQNQIYDFKESSRNLPAPNPANNEFVAALREHLLIIAKTAFDVLKNLNIDRTDIDVVLLNYSGKFKETTKEFLQRMFLEKPIIELQTSRTVTALGAAIYGAIEKS